jgi:hypothetical protein
LYLIRHVFGCSVFGTVASHHPKVEWERSVDVTKIIAELRQEREQIEEAIISLERLARGRGRRRGRPPAWLTVAKKRGRPPGSKNKNTGAVKPAVA